MKPELLHIKKLKVNFFLRKGTVKAVDRVDLQVTEDETVGIVGESGSGKTITALSIMRLISSPGRIVDGEIILKGKDILKIPLKRMLKIRGNEVSMIFQEPTTSLNPVFTVGRQISEAIMIHQKLGKKEALRKSIDMLAKVGIASPEKRIHNYPHQLSGGLRQRVMIAMALSCKPSLLIADEPTTALDVTIQAQILDLISKLKEDQRTSVIVITHDLGIIAEMAQRVVVMYAGKVMEQADVRTIFKRPLHPYTQGLVRAIPYLKRKRRHEKLFEIPGIVPSLLNHPSGCKFYPRCPHGNEKCKATEPDLTVIENEHFARCWLCHG